MSARMSVLIGDAREQLSMLPDKSVNCIVTSPPYFGQRNYGIVGQLGLESDPETYIDALTAVFSEARRVLCDDGTLWLNIGDSYNNRTRVRSSSHKPIKSGEQRPWREVAAAGGVRMTITRNGWKEKDLFGVPWALANALRKDGWFLRQEIIWHKPVAKLDVARDRPSTRHEQVFLLSKSKVYHFDASRLPKYARGSVWTIPATGHESHGAAFPERLVEPCILAGCPEGGRVLDLFCGSGTTGMVAARLGFDATLIDLNPDYAALAQDRMRAVNNKNSEPHP